MAYAMNVQNSLWIINMKGYVFSLSLSLSHSVSVYFLSASLCVPLPVSLSLLLACLHVFVYLTESLVGLSVCLCLSLTVRLSSLFSLHIAYHILLYIRYIWQTISLENRNIVQIGGHLVW